MNDQRHIEKIKENFIKRGGYSSRINPFSLKGNCFSIDLREINGMVSLFNALGVKFPLETELSQEDIFEESWDFLDDSIGGGMISEAEKGSVCYSLIGFEEFSDKYPDVWELYYILYKNADYIRKTNTATGDVKIYIFR